jgi:hypothetical protein
MQQSKEELQERGYLVQECEAFCGKKYSTETDIRFRAALEKRLYLLLPELMPAQLVRLVKATCKVDYPSAVDRNFHDQIMRRLGTMHRLSEVRKVEIPGSWMNDRHGRAVLAPPVKV